MTDGGVFTSADSRVKELEEKLAKITRAHEALLNTLGASTHPWIVKVHRNAKAYFDNWKGAKP